MISLDDLKICENCGNIFVRKLKNEILYRCPACDVWKRENEN